MFVGTSCNCPRWLEVVIKRRVGVVDVRVKVKDGVATRGKLGNRSWLLVHR